MKITKFTSIIALLLVPCAAALAEELNARSSRWEVEAGVLRTRNMEIHGYHQANATDGWESTDPTVRLEYWSKKQGGWNYGLVLQPLYASYDGTIQHELNNKGQVFHEGDDGSLDYQFHTLRFSANYPVLVSGSGESYLRLGGSVVARYAKVKLRTSNASFDDTNFIAIPLANVEAQAALTSKHSLFFRADFLPAIDGNVFLDGLFDVLFAFRTSLDNKRTLDIGTRLFFGGYDPNKIDDYANNIFFEGLVARYSF